MYESSACWFYDNKMKFIEIDYDENGDPSSFLDPFGERW